MTSQSEFANGFRLARERELSVASTMAIVHLVLIQVKADADLAAVRDVGSLPTHPATYLFDHGGWEGGRLVILVMYID